jgi:SAM-dependent MidA family methyltransferase
MNDKTTIAADDPLAQQHSDHLKELIAMDIAKQGGFISFAEYMQHCLYHPGLGYYSAGSHKLGQGGDFTTAPEISPLFGFSLATHINDALAQCESKTILEFGAGSGKLAVAILSYLNDIDALPKKYFILEVSADLQTRQQQLIKQALPELFCRVEWIASIPEPFSGVMIANEVCDAMPVNLLRLTDSADFERGVTVVNNQFQWSDRPLTVPRLLTKAKSIKQQLEGAEYLTEVNLFAEDWLKTIASGFHQGALFLIDYGYPFSELYSSERVGGTLRSYYRQQTIDNPLLLPGLQDISAHVDFSSLAEAASQAGLHVAGFHEQADFLIAGDITQIAAEQQKDSTAISWLEHSAALKQLLLPNEMGHQFKVLTLTQNIDLLPRLQLQDRRYQL